MLQGLMISAIPARRGDLADSPSGAPCRTSRRPSGSQTPALWYLSGLCVAILPLMSRVP
jgi:hypothetical protein